MRGGAPLDGLGVVGLSREASLEAEGLGEILGAGLCLLLLEMIVLGVVVQESDSGENTSSVFSRAWVLRGREGKAVGGAVDMV